jgi:hypothetical protein
LGNGIRNTFATIIAIAKGIGMIVAVNWENKLVCCTTNVGFFYCNGCCSTISNNGFLTILILSSAALLCSCEIDSSLILILNKFVRRYLVGVKNLCIGCKDCVPISVCFCLGMRVFDYD